MEFARYANWEAIQLVFIWLAVSIPLGLLVEKLENVGGHKK